MHWMLLLLALDLSAIKNEPNLEKLLSALAEVGESVDLSWHSLTDTGKYARNNKFFKRAEVRTRELLRRLDGLRDIAAVDDHSAIEKVRARVADVHDALIQGIMGKKAKK
jgi:hypothetical protein